MLRSVKDFSSGISLLEGPDLCPRLRTYSVEKRVLGSKECVSDPISYENSFFMTMLKKQFLGAEQNLCQSHQNSLTVKHLFGRKTAIL